jgi:uncharacterized membrane protein YjfL (UPF0719 family)
MEESNLLGITAGLLAYCVAILLCTGPLVYAAYWLDKALTKKIDEDALLKAGNRSIAIELGITVLCQAILIRHAVFSAMAVVRSLFIEDLSWNDSAWVIGRSFLCVVVIVILALSSVQIAGFLFKRCIRHMNVEESIRDKDNIAMAIFYALALLSITLILNEGMDDFARSLIPYGRAGIVTLQ